MVRKSLSPNLKPWCAGLIVPVMIITGWEIAVRLRIITTLFLPPPSVVLRAGSELFVQWGVMAHVWSSISLVLRGFFMGTVAGFLVGAACGLALMAGKVFCPLLNALRQVPTIAWLPVIAFAVGHEDVGKLSIIALSVFFPVFVNTLHGITYVSQEYIEVARIFQFSRWHSFRRVILPEALPAIFTGIRYGAGMSWSMILFAEMFSGRKGLGYLLSRRQELLVADESIVLLVVIGLLGFMVDYSIICVERRMTPWSRQMQNSLV